MCSEVWHESAEISEDIVDVFGDWIVSKLKNGGTLPNLEYRKYTLYYVIHGWRGSPKNIFT
jgi:hypothetical protein